MTRETILALATAPGRAALAVLRLSGPLSGELLTAIAGRRPKPRRASLRKLSEPRSGEILDEALVLWFPGPASYTGEDCAELHLHGGVAVVNAVVVALLGRGARMAEPGEFTRRAFENGKLDLSQAEAVADLIDAETEAQRRQALGQLDGELGRRHAAWRNELIETLAVLEAAVDFPDEDLPSTISDEASPRLTHVLAGLDAALSDGERGERVREGYRIAIIGAPNAGKSSLFNALTDRDAAIVTDIAGTTRDVIEAPLILAGYRVLLADTAGLRPTVDTVEAEGVRRATAWATGADLRLMVVDTTDPDPLRADVRGLARSGDFCLLNKTDLGVRREDIRSWAIAEGLPVLDVSATDGAGLEGLRCKLSETVVGALAGGEFPAATRERHRRDLVAARDHLNRGLDGLASGTGPELAAEDVRLAARALARVGGRIDPEDVLDRVFARFCIGK